MSVDELEIEGFKPLKSLKFGEDDLGMVNVITGRNNTGKSSILEAIGLLYNPSHLESFSSHAGYLINKDTEECVVSDGERGIKMHLAAMDEYPDIYDRTISRFISDIYIRTEERFEEAENLHQVPYDEDDDEGESVIALWDFIDEVLGNNQLQLSKSIRQNLDKNVSDILIIEVDRDDSPYACLSGKNAEFAESIVGIISDILQQEVDNYEHVSGFVYPPLSLNQGFLFEEPLDTERAKLIKTPITDITDYEPESEQDAVKIDDIEDYITERGLVDNLKDFDLDYLVFDEDGEKDSVPFDFMGDGFKSMVGILWELVEDDESEIVMIEEPENHMHPGYVQEMFDFLVTMSREDDIQLFITTHSIDFINYMFDENLPEEHREFLKDELSVIRMESPELAAVFDYEEAQKNSEELHLDLRGI